MADQPTKAGADDTSDKPWEKYARPAAATTADPSDDKPWEKYAKTPAVPITAGAPTTPPAQPAPKTGYDKALEVARKHEKGDELPGALYQGVTLGFGKDIDAGGAYVSTALANLLKRAMGKDVPYSASEASQATRQAEKETQEKFHAEHPAGATVADLVGSLMTPGIGASSRLAEKFIGSPAVRSALIGAGVGGLSAAGNTEGDILHRVEAVPMGAGAGAVLGTGAHAVMNSPRVLRSIGSGISEAVQQAMAALGNSPEKMSAKVQEQGAKTGSKYIENLVKMLSPDMAKLTGNKAEGLGKPITAAEALGIPAQTQLKVMGRRMGETPDQLRSMLSDRARDAGQRIVNDFHEVTGINPEEAQGNLESLAERLRARAAPLYKNWWSQENIDSPRLKTIRAKDYFKQAIAAIKPIVNAEEKSMYELGLDDQLPLELYGKQVQSGGKPIMVSREEAIKRAEETGHQHTMADTAPDKVPTAQAYDYVKRGLDVLLEKFRDKNTGRLDMRSAEARAILRVRQELNDELTNPNEPWGAAAKAAFDAGGEAPQQEEAFSSAKSLLSNAVNSANFAKRIEKYTPAQMEALRAGVVDEIRNSAMSGRIRMKGLLSDLTQVKLTKLFGGDKAAELMDRLQMEHDMAQTGARMAPGVGSDTSETLLAAGEQDENIAHATKQAIKAGLRHRSPVAALGYGLASVLEGAYRGMQAPIGRAARDTGGKLLMMPPSALAQHLQAAEAARVPTMGEKITEAAAKAGKAATPRTAAAAGAAGGRFVASGISVEDPKDPEMSWVQYTDPDTGETMTKYEPTPQ